MACPWTAIIPPTLRPAKKPAGRNSGGGSGHPPPNRFIVCIDLPFGNAGAFGGEMSDSTVKVDVFDTKEAGIKSYGLKDCNFGYRESVFKYNPDLIILGATFSLKKEKKGTIQDKIKSCLKQRSLSFGLDCSADWRSAGCFFKNIEWKRKDIDKNLFLKNFPELKQFADKSKIPAGFLIDFFSLKGKRIGDAMISEQHANFILNLNKATAEQIIMLTSLIKSRINARYGITLEEEVQLVGF